MVDQDIYEIMAIMEQEFSQWQIPIVTKIAETGNPFQVLLSTVLSLRTKDAVTAEASSRLFSLANTPEKVLELSRIQLEKAIYPVGFYKTKARNILTICQQLQEKYHSQVPHDLDLLLEFPGVGRKTANLVITLGYNLPGICVDTHVHRITNRWGYVTTKTAEKTEFALRRKLPKQFWIPINDFLVSYGQNLCRPISPYCGKCRLRSFCGRVGVTKSR